VVQEAAVATEAHEEVEVDSEGEAERSSKEEEETVVDFEEVEEEDLSKEAADHLAKW
jgi:hypothetical protein